MVLLYWRSRIPLRCSRYSCILKRISSRKSRGLQDGKEKNKGCAVFFKEVFGGILKMPKTMIQLAFVQFFSWLALFALWIYTTPAITEFIYGSTDTTSVAYNEGADWVNVCFAAYNGVAALAAFLLPVIAKLTSRKITHMIGLLCWCCGIVVCIFCFDSQWTAHLNDWYWNCLGKYSFYAVRNFGWILARGKDGLLCRSLQFFYCNSTDCCINHSGFILKHVFSDQTIYAFVIGSINGCSCRPLFVS